eukprot:CAMPEP_0118708048 /NCGR_PEP_ID=MMETSP0800-20121206/21621_1 /TAXON_ID=210618 ORGANISM="Striatella unipunctata, Strain CCMP2910" /NCGR_SAMPLE_ID=MMETSP0800 /ASSEMBLY_ACC=CAM_ASM_000638 /LENGTH=655 /DNA_ID=CAMNT_0006611099 /DNA_START=225 /DNA_END=2195 /DNA_ORIENTATION=-
MSKPREKMNNMIQSKRKRDHHDDQAKRDRKRFSSPQESQDDAAAAATAKENMDPNQDAELEIVKGVVFAGGSFDSNTAATDGGSSGRSRSRSRSRTRRLRRHISDPGLIAKMKRHFAEGGSKSDQDLLHRDSEDGGASSKYQPLENEQIETGDCCGEACDQADKEEGQEDKHSMMLSRINSLFHNEVSRIILAAVLLMVPTAQHLGLLLQHPSLLLLGVCWMTLSFFLGIFSPAGLLFKQKVSPDDKQDWESDHALPPTVRRPSDSSSIVSVEQNEGDADVPSGRFARFRRRMPNPRAPSPGPEKRAPRFWTTLQQYIQRDDHQPSHRPLWQRNVFAPTSEKLMNRLLRNPHIRRKKIRKQAQDEFSQDESEHQHTSLSLVDEPSDVATTTIEDPENALSTPATSSPTIEGAAPIGNVPADSVIATSLVSEVADPLLNLRGIDVFVTDCPEENIVEYLPVLTRCGLRDNPSCVVNVMTPFANIVLYFTLPEWLTSFSNLKEDPLDAHDIKAMKRFLLGSDEYRKNRFKFLPCLVDGPRAMRLLAPPQKETAIWGVEMKWIFHEGNGTEAPMLEVVVDCVSNGLVRRLARLMRRHVHKMTMDMAIVIDSQDGHDQHEASACLGLFRLDQINLDDCPRLPEKSDTEEVNRVLSGCCP